ncbi:MAG: hypothetical protein KF861_17155, partial [Planctomycetaceae bacterium]|nr:hypothetical protein [Planctomycetaceae bacterium]
MTSQEAAEGMLYTVVYDVNDISASSGEDELANALFNETTGPWENIDGVGGVWVMPAPGVMVVRQTESMHREVRRILDDYRRLRAQYEPWQENPAELAT